MFVCGCWNGQCDALCEWVHLWPGWRLMCTDAKRRWKMKPLVAFALWLTFVVCKWQISLGFCFRLFGLLIRANIVGCVEIFVFNVPWSSFTCLSSLSKAPNQEYYAIASGLLLRRFWEIHFQDRQTMSKQSSTHKSEPLMPIGSFNRIETIWLGEDLKTSIFQLIDTSIGQKRLETPSASGVKGHHLDLCAFSRK